MKQLELTATLRSSVGNGPARQLRQQGKIPAVLYGPKSETVMLAVDTKDLESSLKHGTIGQSIFNLTVQGAKKKATAVMIRELQRHPVSGKFLHADFYEIDMKRKIHVMVPVAVTGVSKGVELGGLLQIVRRELEVLCLPTDIPEKILIDITELDIGDAVHVEDLAAKAGYEISEEGNLTVLTVVSPKVEEAVEEEVSEEEAEEAEGEEETEEAAE